MKSFNPYRFCHNLFIKNHILKSSKGFTFIELLIAISVIGILTLISVPTFRTIQPTLQLSGVSRELISDLRYAQQITVTEQVEYCVLFFPTDKKYQIIRCGGTQPIKEKIFPDEIQTVTVSGFTNNEVRYNPYGAVKEAGTIILENTKNITKTILVRPSGFVKIGE